ncbi:MAG: CHAT domain-containing protein [Acidobacteriota bacterium]|nr:CHAT domain-containing protein [Acidobacteriota bacterium]
MTAETQPITAGQTVDRKIAGGNLHPWTWTVAADQVAHLEVQQLGIDVMVRLYVGKEETAELEVDGFDGAWGTERLSVCPQADTEYRVEIEPLSAKAPQAAYRLTSTTPRPATLEDRARAQAERHFDAAERIRRRGDKASKRLAIPAYQEALDLFRETSHLRGRLDTLRRLGWLRGNLGETAKARQRFDELLELARSSDSQLEEGNALNLLGELDYKNHDLDAARQRFTEALAVADEIDDPALRGRSLNNLASLLYLQEDQTGAIAGFQEVAALWQRLGRHQSRARVLVNLSYALERQGKFPEAIDAAREAERLFDQGNDPQRRADALLQLAGIYQAMGRPEDAADALTLALETPTAELDTSTQLKLAGLLGLIQVQMDELESAAHRFQWTLEEASRHGRSLHEAMAALNLSALRQRQGDTEESLKLIQRARKLFAAQEDHRHLAACSFIEALSLRQQGNLQRALEQLEAAVEKVEELRLQQAGWGLRMAFFETRQSYYDELLDLLYELYRQTRDPRYAEQALAAGERRRARSLLDALAEGDLGYRGNAALLDREQRLTRNLATLNTELRLADDPDRPKLEQRQRQVLLELETTRAEIRRSSPQYADLTRPEPLPVEDIRQQVLDSDTVLLVYTLGEKRSLLFLVDRAQPLRVFPLPPRQRIQTAVDAGREALQSLNRGRRAQNHRALQELSDLVLGPIAERLDGRRLAVVADGALETIPFAALPEPSLPGTDEPQPWLLERREVVHLPSASALAALRSETSSRPQPTYQIAVFANPKFSPDGQGGDSATGSPTLERSGIRQGQSLGEALQPLPYTKTEADAIRPLFNPDRSRFLLSTDADRAAFEDPLLEQFAILHLATHGFLDPVNPELSGLALAMVDEDGQPEDGLIRAHELYSRRFSAELVVLSACQTGLGREVRGEGVVGLPRGFLYSGVPRVVMSLWNVADSSTAELMESFYHELEKGFSASAALRRAQLAMLRSDNEAHRQPYHWAPFVFLGDWTQKGSIRVGKGFEEEGDGTVEIRDPNKGEGYDKEGEIPDASIHSTAAATSQGHEGEASPQARIPDRSPPPFSAEVASRLLRGVPSRDEIRRREPLKPPAHFVNGVDGENSALLTSEVDLQWNDPQIGSRERRRLQHWWENLDRLRLPEYGVDPDSLAESGWGVIFGPDVTQDDRDALKDLLKKRQKQAGDLYQEITLAEPTDALSFLEPKGVAFGPVDPKKLPYYLLLVGDPDRLPFLFQYQMDVQFAIGRLHFDQPDDYRRYAAGVLRAEELRDLERPAVLWGTDIPKDENTQWMIHGLVDPLAAELDHWRSTRKRGLYDVHRTVDGRKATLQQLLQEAPPALLFTASHGVVFGAGSPHQRDYHGSLLCEDWRPKSPIRPAVFFSSQDLAPSTDLGGLISFHFACYSTGCSRRDALEQNAFGQGLRLASKAFVSRLSQQLLKQGAQAVVGHVDRAWKTSFTWSQEGDQTRVFTSVLRQLLDGYRLGFATEWIHNRYAECASHLYPLLRSKALPESRGAEKLQDLLKATLDARNYLVIGDPAVRLVGAEARQELRYEEAMKRG